MQTLPRIYTENNISDIPRLLFDDVMDKVGVEARDVRSFSVGVSGTFSCTFSRFDFPLAAAGVDFSFSASVAKYIKEYNNGYSF